jgi:hypothetical protein
MVPFEPSVKSALVAKSAESLSFASWNQIAAWLRQLDNLPTEDWGPIADKSPAGCFSGARSKDFGAEPSGRARLATRPALESRC